MAAAVAPVIYLSGNILYGGTDIVDNYTIIREGESYRSLYGYDYYGVNAANGNPIWSKADGSLVQFDTFGSYDYAEYDPSNLRTK